VLTEVRIVFADMTTGAIARHVKTGDLDVATSELIYPAIPKKRHACVCLRAQKPENQKTPVRLHAQKRIAA